MTWETINAVLAAHHVFPVTAFFVFAWKGARPLLVDLRALLVYVLAIGLAGANRAGITDDMIAAKLPASEKAIPGIPEADAGVLTKILGVVPK